MKIVAVVTELNPFHYGHKYLLQEAKKRSGCDAVLCIMSGQFVQRGSPAIVSMRARAKMALLNGADLVTELPALYATACGELFSEGAINIANSTKKITHLAFGSECGDLEQLQKIAEIQLCESLNFKDILQAELKTGKSYAAAIAEATRQESNGVVVDSPNDILGIEYLKQLKKLNSKIEPLTIKRIGADYHDESFQEKFSSASAIRNLITEKKWTMVKECMPKSAYEILRKETKNSPVRQEVFEAFCLGALLNNNNDNCPDGGGGLREKLFCNAEKLLDYKKAIEATKTKSCTEARLRRIFVQQLFNIKDYPNLNNLNIPTRVLGIRKEKKQALLSVLPNNFIVKNSDWAKFYQSVEFISNKQILQYIKSINNIANITYSILQQKQNEIETECLLEV